MSKSNIEWTTDTWNPIVGCSILSPGCINCYAMKMAARIEAMNTEARETEATSGKKKNIATQYDGTTKKVNGNTVWTGKLALAGEKILLQPLKRKKPTTYFVNSMGDLFHEDVPDEWINKVFAVMALAPQHTFQVLTKRAARMREYFAAAGRLNRLNGWIWSTLGTPRGSKVEHGGNWRAVLPLPNVWLGVSTERQIEADIRIPLLLKTPAAVRFISAEPLLGPVDLTRIKLPGIVDPFDVLIGATWCRPPALDGEKFFSSTIEHEDRPKLDWVIVGGESGTDARPMHPDWARSLRSQCEIAGVPFFFKQWGSFVPIIDRDNEDPDWRRDYGRANSEPDKFKIVNFAGGCGFHGERVHLMQRYSKANAGRALDGIEYSEMPSSMAPPTDRGDEA